jgi:hypothetical protein
MDATDLAAPAARHGILRHALDRYRSSPAREVNTQRP